MVDQSYREIVFLFMTSIYYPNPNINPNPNHNPTLSLVTLNPAHLARLAFRPVFGFCWQKPVSAFKPV